MRSALLVAAPLVMLTQSPYFIGPTSSNTDLNADCTISFDWVRISAEQQ